MGDPIGISMMVGMVASSVFNAVMAAGPEYDDKCRRVDEIHDSIKPVSDWCTQVEAKFELLDMEISQDLDKLKKILEAVKAAIRADKVRQTKLLHKEEIIGTVLSSLVSALLMIKMLSRQL